MAHPSQPAVRTTPPDTAPDGGGAVFSAADVSFGYRHGESIISGVTADLRPGRVAALIGPNAAGKSTLLRVMLGLLDPWEGRVSLGGRDVHAMPAAERARWISYVPQHGHVSFAFTVRQVVAMGRYAHGGPAAFSVRAALERCELWEVADRPFNELSGGQQRRVAVARALAQSTRPDGTAGGVLLADEPVSGMDLWHAHRTLGLLQEAARAGRAVLVVLHDLAQAARWADDVWLMDHGKLVMSGPWDSVMRPEILEPVYRVRLTPVADPTGRGDRPTFFVDPGDTI